MPNNFQLAYSLDFEEDSTAIYQDGVSLGRISYDTDPSVMTVVVQENEGYWLQLPHQIANGQAFFEATGIDLCEEAVSELLNLDQNILGANSSLSGLTISLGTHTYSNPLSDYILLLRSDVYSLHNDLCVPPFDDTEISLRTGDCDRDAWDNPSMVERIIRFKIPTKAARNSIATNTRCNFKGKQCEFLINAYIPTYEGDLSDLTKSFYGRAITKIWPVKRSRLRSLKWIYERNLDFGPWLYNEGRMGDYWLYEMIQKNTKAGQEITVSVNEKFTSSSKFTASQTINGVNVGVETSRTVETTFGQTVKWTERDWPLSVLPVYYCDCQSCNDWQGKEYSTGTLNFSIRECSSLPWCV